MLPKPQRLKTADFKSLRRGQTINAPHFLLRLFRAAPGEGKAAVIVSSSTYKKAVDRNLLRRRMYHIIKTHISALQNRTLTVTVKKGAHTVSFVELEREFLAAVGQANRQP